MFSIIVPDYWEAVSPARRSRCVESLRLSPFQSFEVLWLHDGPAPPSYWEELGSLIGGDRRFQSEGSERRFNDWGHSLRDLGIRRGQGKYILHLNADNVLYPEALGTLASYASQPHLAMRVRTQEGALENFLRNPEVLIFAIRLMGCQNVLAARGFLRQQGMEKQFQLILPGWPPHPLAIDAMQLVATRQIWLAEGGWHLRDEQADGQLLSELAARHGYLVVPEILGEHW